MKKFILAVVSSLLIFSTAYSAPVDIPMTLKTAPRGGGETVEPPPIQFSISGQGEFLDKLKLKSDTGGDSNELESQFYGGKATATINLLGAWDLYGFGGWVHDPKLKNSQFGSNSVRFNFKDGAYYGGGANYLIYRFPEYYGLGLFVDGKYRQITDLKTDTLEVNGVETTAFSDNKKTKWHDWQVAVGAAAKIYYIVPFAGAVYSETKLKTDVSAGGNTFALSGSKNKDPVGGFAGLSIVPNDFVSIDLQGRFIDETGASASVNLKF
ncbi:MAG: hypothetical protein ACM3OC_04925 [Deltaproteobacteria bacterium]